MCLSNACVCPTHVFVHCSYNQVSDSGACWPESGMIQCTKIKGTKWKDRNQLIDCSMLCVTLIYRSRPNLSESEITTDSGVRDNQIPESEITTDSGVRDNHGLTLQSDTPPQLGRQRKLAFECPSAQFKFPSQAPVKTLPNNTPSGSEKGKGKG